MSLKGRVASPLRGMQPNFTTKRMHGWFDKEETHGQFAKKKGHTVGPSVKGTQGESSKERKGVVSPPRRGTLQGEFAKERKAWSIQQEMVKSEFGGMHCQSPKWVTR